MDEMTETEDDQKKRSWQTKKLRRFFHDDYASQDSRRDSSKQNNYENRVQYMKDAGDQNCLKFNLPAIVVAS